MYNRENHLRWKANNREHLRQYQRERYRANPAIFIQRSLTYKRTHPDVVKMIDRRRRVRRAFALGWHTAADWEQVKALYGNRCWLCSSAGKLTEDHIVPLSNGGTNDIDNIAPLCGSCNSSKGNKTIAPFCRLSFAA